AITCHHRCVVHALPIARGQPVCGASARRVAPAVRRPRCSHLIQTATVVNPIKTDELAERMSEVREATPSQPPPVTLVIFGGAGDLAHRKLLPALYNLSVDH